MRLPEMLIVIALAIVVFGFQRLSRKPTTPIDRQRSQTLLVLIVFAVVAFAAMAAQYARIRTGQVPTQSSASSRR